MNPLPYGPNRPYTITPKGTQGRTVPAVAVAATLASAGIACAGILLAGVTIKTVQGVAAATARAAKKRVTR